MSAKYRQAFSNTLCGITQQPQAQHLQARTYYGNHKSSTNGHQQRHIRQELLSQGRNQETGTTAALTEATAATTHEVVVRAHYFQAWCLC